MKRQPITTVQFWSEKSPAFFPIEIENPTVSGALFLEINLESKCRGLSPRKSVRNREPAAVALPVFQANPRLCSSPEVAVLGRERPASSPCGCDIFAPAGQRHSVPTSSAKVIRWQTSNLLPHENGIRKIACAVETKCLKKGGMRRKIAPAKRGCGKFSPQRILSSLAETPRPATHVQSDPEQTLRRKIKGGCFNFVI
jgi:hypothetical protein